MSFSLSGQVMVVAAVVVVTMTLLPPSLASPALHAKRFRKKSDEEKFQSYWHGVANDELRRTLNVKHNNNVAKNVILFLGDGMSVPTVTAARIYKGQQSGTSGEEGSLFFERFPHTGLSKTYNVDKQVSDSASTATAYLTGVKTNYKTLGIDGTGVYKDCTSVTEDNKVYSIVQWAQDAGKRTGVVTSTRVTHATPAATYAHVADRDWECDSEIPEDCKEHTKDIARQLVEDKPGSLINVVMGGGKQVLDSNPIDTPDDPVDDEWGCLRNDSRNLTDTWLNDKKKAGYNSMFVKSKSEMDLVDTDQVEYLLGIFSNGHMQYEHDKRERDLDVPTLAEMTEVAIKVLKQEPKGYFLLVEGGRIDHAHHDTKARRALDETVAMDEAVERAVELTAEQDTLVVVTADHSHTMSINGYPLRGQEIVGLAALDDTDLAYTTLMYANGPGYDYTVVDDKVSRPNVTSNVAKGWDYEQLAAVLKGSETHGGDDVAIYALGPMSHLFHGLHEQNYIAHAMAYSACIGEYEDKCHGGGQRVVPAITLLSLLTLVAPHWLLS